MPLIKIQTVKGKSTQQKKLILNSLVEITAQAYKIAPAVVLATLEEIDEDNYVYASCKDGVTVVELVAYPGRSEEIKNNFFIAVFEFFQKECAMPQSDVMITITELPKENWGLYGTQGSKL